MKDSSQPAKRRRYGDAFRAETLRLAEQSRSTQATARALNINAKLRYKWQKEALTLVAAARGAELDPATAAELRALARRQAQELAIWAAFLRPAYTVMGGCCNLLAHLLLPGPKPVPNAWAVVGIRPLRSGAALGNSKIASGTP